MATAPATKKMMEEAACSICLQMPEPVSISCGHSLCHRCITGKFENQPQGTSQLRRSHCPLCQAPFEKGDIRPNQQLENFTESIRELEHERLCEEHGKQLHLFCEDDGQLICWRCERSPRHRGHSTALVEYAGPRYRKILQKVLTELEEEEKHCLFMKLITKDQIRQWEDKIARERRKIQCEFEKLYNFLHEEEQWFLWRLEEKKEQTLRKMQENEASLEKQRQEYKSRILELEEKCEQSAQDMLQNMRDTLGRCMAMNTEVPEAVSLELQTVCNVSELYLDMKKILKSYQVRVTLDPETAHTDLIVSEDRRQVIYGGPEMNLNSSLRFENLPSVLGCERFTSGRHYFEVDVGEDSSWELGVCLENVHKGVSMNLQPESGFWVIRSSGKQRYWAFTSRATLLRPKKLQVLGVFVDFEAGRVSFYNMTTASSHIFTFSGATFSDTLRPFFGVFQSSPLFLHTP